MNEDELVSMYLDDAETIIRGIARDSKDDSKWCPAYHGEDRCFAAITCPECRIRIFIGQGAGEEG